MFTIIRYNINKDHYAMLIIKASSSLCHGDLFKNGNHHKAFLWRNERYENIKKQFFDNAEKREIELESVYEYKQQPFDVCYRKILNDLDLVSAYGFNTNNNM